MFFKNGSSKLYSSYTALLMISSKSECDTFDNEISYKEDPTFGTRVWKVLTRGMVRFLTAANDSGGIWLGDSGCPGFLPATNLNRSTSVKTAVLNPPINKMNCNVEDQTKLLEITRARFLQCAISRQPDRQFAQQKLLTPIK
jgi:hypothetical protein